jgi:YHS domain-containing protein
VLLAGVAFVALAGLAFFSGCKKEPPAAQQTQPAQQTHAQEQAPADQPPVEAVTAQTTCPVMGGAINKTIFVEYQGKKVYFCCQGCPETFLANPEKYVAKLPQFQD